MIPQTAGFAAAKKKAYDKNSVVMEIAVFLLNSRIKPWKRPTTT
jgi:hypothetical protein